MQKTLEEKCYKKYILGIMINILDTANRSSPGTKKKNTINVTEGEGVLKNQHTYFKFKH